MPKLRKWLKDEEATILGLKPKEKKQKHRKSARYIITPEEWDYIQEIRNKGVDEALENLGAGKTNTPYMWLKTKNASAFVRNPEYETPEQATFKDLENHILDKVKKIVDKGIEPIKSKKLKFDKSVFDFLCFTDTHIGMQPNPNGFSLYGGKWDREELFERIDIMIRHTKSIKRNDTLIIFDLGDYLDGWDSKTTRKQHTLPQNMTNEEAFDCGLDAKIYLIDQLSQIYDNIEFINIVDDNHSGSFAYVTNKAVKQYVDVKYPNVKFIIQRKFIDYYVYDNKCFIATHGKDGENLKFGFKPQLDPKQIDIIENYIAENNLHQYDIYFIKGDSHQDIFDNTTAQKFKYWNFPALSPSSNWVQTNFKKGISGFYAINFRKKSYRLSPIYFDWKK